MSKFVQDKQEGLEVFEGVKRTTLACGRDILLARFDYDSGSAVPPHRHAYEQVTHILSGEQRISLHTPEGVDEFVVGAGGTYVVPAGTEHEQFTLKTARTLDAWSLSP